VLKDEVLAIAGIDTKVTMRLDSKEVILPCNVACRENSVFITTNERNSNRPKFIWFSFCIKEVLKICIAQT
jgi:hypothetical protein